MARVGKISFDLAANSAEFTAGLNAAERAMASMQSKAAEFVGRVDGAFDSISKKASASAKAMDTALKQQRDSMQRMIDAADPAAAKLRQIAVAEAEVNKALAYGTITAEEHTLIMSNIGKVAGVAGRGYANFGMLVQQAGYQISDVFAVAASGGNVMAQAGTQLGQFLGFMGPWGAVVGAAVTALGLLATNLFKTGEASDEAKHSADLYEKSLNDLLDIEKEYNKVLRERQGLPALSGSLDSLKQRALEAKGHAEVESEKDPSLVSGLWSSFKQKIGFSRSKTDAELARANENQANSDLSYAREIDEATQDEKVTIALGKLNDERDREAALLKVSSGERDKARAMAEAELEVRKQLAETYASPQQVESEVAKARAFAAATYDQQKSEEAAAKSQEKLRQEREKELAEEVKQEEARSKISGSMQREISDNDQLITALQTSEAEYEKVKALLEVINQYRQAGIEMSPDELKAAEDAAKRLGEQRQQMDELKDKYQSMKKLGADLGMTFSSAFEDAIVEGKKFSDVLQSLYQDVLRLLVRQSITQPLASSAGSWFSSIFKAIGFASGTPNAPPGMAWVGERGPELIKFRGGEQVFPAHLSQAIASTYRLPGYADGAYDSSALSGGDFGRGGGVEVNVINKSGADIKTQRRNVGGIDTIDVLVDQAVARKLSQRGSGSNRAIRQTFGASEKLVSR